MPPKKQKKANKDSTGSYLDSGFRRNDDHLDPFVIPAKAGIQEMRHSIIPLFVEKLQNERSKTTLRNSAVPCSAVLRFAVWSRGVSCEASVPPDTLPKIFDT